jgi:Peptidase A4 family
MKFAIASTKNQVGNSFVKALAAVVGERKAVYTTTLMRSAPMIVCLVILSCMAWAQSEAARQLYVTAATVSTNIPDIHTFAEPFSGFNPLVASDIELASYGFPPRPDKQVDSNHYRMWERAMLAAKNRWREELRPMRPERMPSASAPAHLLMETASAALPPLPATPTTLNWSGVALTKPLTKWSSSYSFADIYSIMSVPTGEQPFAVGGCDQYYQLSWVGLDGYTKLAAVQPAAPKAALIGGVTSFMSCGPTTVNYYATFGWDPIYDQIAFPVNPGDVVYVEVQSPPGGANPAYIFLEDLTTLTYNAYSVPVPPGETFVGNSAQWIVERWCCRNSGYPYPLLNTIATFFDGGAAVDGLGHRFYPGSQAVSTQVITMRDDSNSQNIELITQGTSGFEGQHALLFQTTGCAYAGGCVQK